MSSEGSDTYWRVAASNKGGWHSDEASISATASVPQAAHRDRNCPRLRRADDERVYRIDEETRKRSGLNVCPYCSDEDEIDFGKMPDNECPFCDKKVKMLPSHLPNCPEK